MSLDFLHNAVLNTDSYKASHWLQYRPGTEAMFSYVESRGGVFDRTLFFGLQSILKEYLSVPVTAQDIQKGKDFFQKHGLPFNEAGWQRILDRFGGFLPLKIRAVPEGTLVPAHNIMMSVESTDPETFWLASYAETALLRLWYPTTVATKSWFARQIIDTYLKETSDEPDGQNLFKLHDFGARSVSSAESAALGGMSHLVNFRGSDTVLGVLAAQEYYGEPMAGFSIPAAEHSTVTSWGRDREAEAYRNMVRLFGKPGAVFAVVSDSYDLFAALDIWGGELKDSVIKSGATLVVRPDSGDPASIVLRTAQKLEAAFGCSTNSRGFKVLEHVRIIQGDGVNLESIASILEGLKKNGFAADNIAFGMGGDLLQKINRDTQKFAMKCSAIRIDGKWIDVYKEPVTDLGKASKRGRLSLFRNQETGALRTCRLREKDGWQDHIVESDYPQSNEDDAMIDVWENGKLLIDQAFSEVRQRAASAALSPEETHLFLARHKEKGLSPN